MFKSSEQVRVQVRFDPLICGYIEFCLFEFVSRKSYSKSKILGLLILGYLLAYKHTYVHVWGVYICTHTYIYITHIHICTCVCVYTHIYTRVRMHTYVHTYMCVCVYTKGQMVHISRVNHLRKWGC